MNYIAMINHFWQIRRSVRLTPIEADLYYFLMQESNTRGWENPFVCANGIIASTMGVSEKAMIAARNKLQIKGLIKFERGVKKTRSPRYTLTFGETENQRDCKMVSKNGSKTGSKSDSKTVNIYINKTKLNHTEEEENNKEEENIAANETIEQTFVPPTLDQVVQYFANEKQISVQEANLKGENFYHFYNSKDWMVGKNKMTNWRSAATKSLSWNTKQYPNGKEQHTASTRQNYANNRKAAIVQLASEAIAQCSSP